MTARLPATAALGLVALQLFDATTPLLLPVAGLGLLLLAWRPPAARPLLRVELAFGIFLAGYALAALLGNDPARSFALSVAALPAAALLVLTSRGGPDAPACVARAVGALVAAQALVVLATAARLGSTDPQAIVSAARLAWLVVPNDFAAAACALPWLWPLARERRDARAAVVVASVLVVAAAVLLQSRTALLALLVAGAAWWSLSAPPVRRARTAFGALALVAAGLAALLYAKSSASLDVRLALWEAAWRLFAEHPAAGVGPHEFGQVYRDVLPAAGGADPRQMPWPHNLVLELAAETGLVGLAAALAALAVGFPALRCADPRAPAIRAGWAVLSAFAVVALAEASLIRLWTWTILVTTIAAFSSACQDPAGATGE